jgi:hypothetical protein
MAAIVVESEAQGWWVEYNPPYETAAEGGLADRFLTLAAIVQNVFNPR